MDNNNLFSIGDTAKLFNISVQALRHYDKIGLLKPSTVNPETGYRYYSPDQFHYIDRIKYLQNMGLPLSEIKDILQSGKVDDLVASLRNKKKSLEQELRALEGTIQDIQWYIEYFGFLGDTGRAEGQVYTTFMEERYMLTAPCSPSEPFWDIEMYLTQLKNSEQFSSLEYRRQYGFVVDVPDLLAQKFSPTAATIFLKNRPDFESPYITRLPAGLYLCFTAKIRLDDWDAAPVNRYFETSGASAVFAVANEYEDNLTEYTATPYEVQIYLEPK